MKLIGNTVVPLELFDANIEHLEGQTVRLCRVQRADISRFHSLWHNSALTDTAGLGLAPELDKLIEDCFKKRRIIVWQITASANPSPLGYAGWVLNRGNPFTFIHLNELDRLDLGVAHEALALSALTYFHLTHGNRLFVYLFRPVDDSIHMLLIDNGFDPIVDITPGVNDEFQAAYVMERSTFEAYFDEPNEPDE